MHDRTTEFTQRIAKLDNRPTHPEDYIKTVQEIAQNGWATLEIRLKYLEQHAELINGFCAIKEYFKTGKLKDDYTGELLYTSPL